MLFILGLFFNPFQYLITSQRIYFFNIFYGVDLLILMFVKSLLNNFSYLVKMDVAIKKLLNGNFIGCVKNRCQGPALFPCVNAQFQTREAVEIRLFKCQ